MGSPQTSLSPYPSELLLVEGVARNDTLHPFRTNLNSGGQFHEILVKWLTDRVTHEADREDAAGLAEGGCHVWSSLRSSPRPLSWSGSLHTWEHRQDLLKRIQCGSPQQTGFGLSKNMSTCVCVCVCRCGEYVCWEGELIVPPQMLP